MVRVFPATLISHLVPRVLAEERAPQRRRRRQHLDRTIGEVGSPAGGREQQQRLPAVLLHGHERAQHHAPFLDVARGQRLDGGDACSQLVDARCLPPREVRLLERACVLVVLRLRLLVRSRVARRSMRALEGLEIGAQPGEELGSSGTASSTQPCSTKYSGRGVPSRFPSFLPRPHLVRRCRLSWEILSGRSTLRSRSAAPGDGNGARPRRDDGRNDGGVADRGKSAPPASARAPGLRAYAALEMVIGLAGALGLAPGFRVLERLDSALHRHHPGLAPVLQLGGILLVLGLPAAAMGATVPVFGLIARRLRTSIAVTLRAEHGRSGARGPRGDLSSPALARRGGHVGAARLCESPRRRGRRAHPAARSSGGAGGRAREE